MAQRNVELHTVLQYTFYTSEATLLTSKCGHHYKNLLQMWYTNYVLSVSIFMIQIILPTMQMGEQKTWD